jgi:hypothetical protein
MESCQPSRETAAAPLPFLVTAYLPDDSGTWVPSMMPVACPASEKGVACRVRLDHRRARKTGPCVPVAVLACATHGRHFTLYPCGHVPYGRELVAPVGLDGQALLTTATASTAPTAEEPCTLWRQTRFSAVLDAALGKAWPRDGPGSNWTTQLRRLDELAALLGLEPVPSAALGEKLARLLDVPRLSLLDDARRLARAVGFETRGGILITALERASSGRCLLERVLACGTLAGLWRPALLWRATPGGPRCTTFPGRGTPSG